MFNFEHTTKIVASTSRLASRTDKTIEQIFKALDKIENLVSQKKGYIYQILWSI
jgi:hypothetical protein